MRILFILLLASLGLNAQDTRVDWDYHNKGYAGKFYIKNLVRSVDTSTYKLIGINPATGEAVYMNWLYAGGGGGSTSPSGSNGYVQIYRNGLFKNASDSLVFTTLLAIKGGLSTTADMQISGISGFGMAPSSGVRAYIKGSGASTSTYGLAIQNSSAQNYLLARDDHLIQIFGNIDVDATPTASNPLGVVINAKSANNTSTTYNTTMKNSDNAYISTLANNGDLSVLNRIIAGTTAPTTPTSTLDIRGSMSAAGVTKIGAYSLTAADYVVEGYALAGTFTLTLPTAVGISGRIYGIVCTGANYVTVATTSSQTIGSGGPTSYIVNYTDVLWVQSDNVNWRILNPTRPGTYFYALAADANLITGPGVYSALPVPTANRTITLPAASTWAGREIIIHNKSNSGTFSWSFSTTVLDAAGATLTTLTNSTFYKLISDGTNIYRTN